MEYKELMMKGKKQKVNHNNIIFLTSYNKIQHMIPIHSSHMYNNNTLLYYGSVHLDDTIQTYRIFNTELVPDCFLYFLNFYF